MDNQHKKITGYRDLTAEEIEAMNNLKAIGNQMDDALAFIESTFAPTPGRQTGQAERDRVSPVTGSYDARQLALARTCLEEGVMHAVRAIAQPRSF
ncbi:MAG: hypothetical protein AB7V19_07495 [Candidatus Bipolaricaulia bacterium]